MIIFKYFMFVLALFWITSCSLFGISGLGSGGGSSIIILPSINEDNKRATSGRLSRTTTSRRSRSCEDSSDCEAQCEDIYDHDIEDEVKVDLCLQKNSKTVEAMYLLWDDLLEDISPAKLRLIKDEYLDEFEVFLDISLEPWRELTEGWNEEQSTRALKWIDGNSDIFDAFDDASNYENYNEIYEKINLKSILSNISNSSNCIGYVQALCEEQAGSRDPLYSSFDADFQEEVAKLIDECAKDSGLKTTAGSACKDSEINNANLKDKAKLRETQKFSKLLETCIPLGADRYTSYKTCHE